MIKSKADLKKIKWLFFDLGSTLIDERLAYEHRLQEIADLAAVSYETVLQTALEFYGQNQKGDAKTARKLGVSLPKWRIEDERLYKDAAKCLQRLSQAYKIGIIANQQAGTESRLRQHGIRQYINLVTASAEEGIAKPDPGIFLLALRRSQCSPDNAVMIGDRIDNDIVPAKALGMHTVWVKQGFGRYWNIKGREEQAEFEVENLTELEALFL